MAIMPLINGDWLFDTGASHLRVAQAEGEPKHDVVRDMLAELRMMLDAAARLRSALMPPSSINRVYYSSFINVP